MIHSQRGRKNDVSTKRTRAPRTARRGLTLIEMMLAIGLTAGLMLVLAALATAVQKTAKITQGDGEITQHARVVAERLGRVVRGATTSAAFPGVMVITASKEGAEFPDTLVVWSPESGAASNPAAGPLVSELVVFTWNPAAPNELLEISDRADTSAALTAAELAAWQNNDAQTAWQAVVDSMLASATVSQVVLTDRLRVASASLTNGTDSTYLRGCVRFDIRYAPSQDDWNDYRDGVIAWEDLPWALGIGGPNYGLRQVAVWHESQLNPGDAGESYSETELPPVPFFGSASLYYQLEK